MGTENEGRRDRTDKFERVHVTYVGMRLRTRSVG